MVEQYASELRIPKERVAVLIGAKGAAKRSIERKTKTKITVLKDGEVIVVSEDAVQSYLVSVIVRAIGRGFNPDIALILLDEQNTLEVIDIKSFTKGSKKKMARLKSRLIGKQGKARSMIEMLTQTHISIYGKTASIIGEINNVLLARQAMEKLLQGAPHGNVYNYIQHQKKA